MSGSRGLWRQIGQPAACRLYRETVIVTTLAIVLSACATMAPRFKAPALPVAPNYPEDAHANSTGAPVTAVWRDYFADPHLQKLIELSLKNNRDLRVAALRVQEERAA